MPVVAVIIPTWNNPEYLYPCVQSILNYTQTEDLIHVYIVNNGEPQHMEPFKNNKFVTVLQQGKNLGWEGGLKAGIAASKEPYILFMNDDTMIPIHQRLWINSMLKFFSHPECAAVGPTSNVVMGRQNIFSFPTRMSEKAKFLIGFCMLVKREDLEKVGGVDDTLPGGDDLDLSIRFRKAGKHLVIDNDTFVWHHGFKTGTRVKGSEWNSAEMTDRTNHALIRKHGLRWFLDLWGAQSQEALNDDVSDKEGDVVRKYVKGDDVLELGCGDKKTVPHAVGVDMVPLGAPIPGLDSDKRSVADIVGDIQKELPVEGKKFDTVIVRHCLEHCVESVAALKLWGSALKEGGRLILAVPNHSLFNTIPMNFQHVAGYTPKSLKDFMEALGWKTVVVEDPGNNVSFVGVFEK